MRYSRIIILLFSLSAISCSGNHKSSNIWVDLESENQVIDGFGASDAWRCQFVGVNWPLVKREAIADLLFSKEFDDKENQEAFYARRTKYTKYLTVELNQIGHN